VVLVYIEVAMKKIYYEKVGRKYVPVSEYDGDLLSALPRGAHLIMVYPGGKSTRYNIDPNYAALIAAGRVAEDAISRVIMDTSALRVPEKSKPLTEEQNRAWKAFNEAMGNERFALEWCSYREAAEAGVKAMQAEAEKLMENESIKQAYEHFITFCELAKSHNQVDD
jgi:hypothetical protein